MAKGQGYKPFSDWSDKRKENHIKYDQEKYSVIGAKLTRDQADLFRNLCKRNNVSVSAALSVFVRACTDCDSLDVIPGQKNHDPAFPQGDQASAKDTHGTVGHHPVSDTPGTVGIPENASD